MHGQTNHNIKEFNMKLFSRIFAATAAVLFCAQLGIAADQQNTPWSAIVEKAKGQTIYFNGWGGAEPINDYVAWAADQVKERYDIKVNHVKVTDIGEVVSRILAEKSGGRTDKGSVDLMWINGENFRAMKEQGLLASPYSEQLPNYQYVDTENKPTTLYDFTIPVDNMEVPWGMAQLVFMYDTAKLASHPHSMTELLATAGEYPGRITYPSPPNFHGTTFLKQVLLELVDDQALLAKPVVQEDFARVTAPLWAYLDKLHPLMWRGGKTFPANASEMKQLLNDGEIFISLSFNPNDASNAIANDELPPSIRCYVHDKGTIGNTHFVAVTFNSGAKEAAMVFANFLLSPEAQARKADPAIWGDPTVLAVGKLPQQDRALFSNIEKGEATLSAEELGRVLPEPHPSWVQALEQEWQKRYSK